jgi:hypothetical protein
VIALRRLFSLRARLSRAWDLTVSVAYVAGCYVDLATRRRVRLLEMRVETVELELALRRPAAKEVTGPGA